MTEIPKITELEIEGFRSFKKTVWKPGNLNIVIGKNGSGKTNLLKALELLSHCAKGGLADYISDSGGMNALLWDGKLYKFSFKILVKELLDFEPLTGSYSILLDNTPSTSGFRVAKETFSDLAKIYGDVILERTGVRLKYYNASEGQFYEPSIKNGHVREEAILSYPIMAFPSIPPSYNEFIDFLKGWTIYQSINTDQNSQIRREAEVRNVAQIAPDGQNLINVLHSLYQSPESPDFKEDIDKAMFAAFGDEYKELTFSPDARGRVLLGIRWKSLRRVTTSYDLSDGTLRFLFLITVLANPNPPTLFAIEEPELGLHPRMMGIVAEFAERAAERTQVVFTTHSSQFLSMFGKDSTPTVTVATWHNGETLLANPPKEKLEVWLKNFTLGELLDSNELENMALDELGIY